MSLPDSTKGGVGRKGGDREKSGKQVAEKSRTNFRYPARETFKKTFSASSRRTRGKEERVGRVSRDVKGGGSKKFLTLEKETGLRENRGQKLHQSGKEER